MVRFIVGMSLDDLRKKTLFKVFLVERRHLDSLEWVEKPIIFLRFEATYKFLIHTLVKGKVNALVCERNPKQKEK